MIYNSADIILTTYRRPHLLEHALKSIYDRTNFPHRILVVNNDKTDDKTIRVLKEAKLHGYITDFVSADSNGGQASALDLGFKMISDGRAFKHYAEDPKFGSSRYVIATQDDLEPPLLKPCWLTRMVHIMETNPELDALGMRIERTRHRDIDEMKDVIPSPSGLPAVFRLMRWEDAVEIGGFGKAKHWEGVTFSEKMKSIGKPHLGMTTHIYATHTGFMPSNRGFEEGFEDYYTFSPERVNQGEEQPYPKIDPVTNIPVQIVTERDAAEQRKRENYYKYWGVDFRIPQTKHLTSEQKELAKYCETGFGLDLGCGKLRCHPNAIGVDIHHESDAEIKADCRDLWMFEDDSLDFIVNSHVLEHMPDFINVLKEWKRALKPGGIMAIAVPDGEMKSKYILYNGHKNNIGINTLRMVFGRILGMKILRLEHVKKNAPNKFVALIVAQKR